MFKWLKISQHYSIMKIYELMAMSAPLLRRLVKEGVEAEDIKFLPLMVRYEEMKHAIKKVAIVKILSEEFDVSERFVYKITEKLDREV